MHMISWIVVSQVNKMQEQHWLESSVGHIPLPLVPSYVQPGTNQPIQVDLL